MHYLEYTYTKTIIYCFSESQIYWGILYFYLLNLAPLTGRAFPTAALDIRGGREGSKGLRWQAGRPVRLGKAASTGEGSTLWVLCAEAGAQVFLTDVEHRFSHRSGY